MSTRRQERLARRYPLLRDVPPQERSALVRAAILHPLVLGAAGLFAFLLLPPYVDRMFYLLDLQSEASPLLFLAKVGGVVLLPLCLLVPLLTKVLMPYRLRSVMRKRGFGPSASDSDTE